MKNGLYSIKEEGLCFEGKLKNIIEKDPKNKFKILANYNDKDKLVLLILDEIMNDECPNGQKYIHAVDDDGKIYVVSLPNIHVTADGERFWQGQLLDHYLIKTVIENEVDKEIKPTCGGRMKYKDNKIVLEGVSERYGGPSPQQYLELIQILEDLGLNVFRR